MNLFFLILHVVIQLNQHHYDHQEGEGHKDSELYKQIPIGTGVLEQASKTIKDSEREQHEASRSIEERSEGGPLIDQERAALVLSSYKKSLEKSETLLAGEPEEPALPNPKLSHDLNYFSSIPLNLILSEKS
jgi:hypothetical protein